MYTKGFKICMPFDQQLHLWEYPKVIQAPPLTNCLPFPSISHWFSLYPLYSLHFSVHILGSLASVLFPAP